MVVGSDAEALVGVDDEEAEDAAGRGGQAEPGEAEGADDGPASARQPAILERMRAERRQLACVINEFGGFAGIITLEDIAEELVGTIRDEADLRPRVTMMAAAAPPHWVCRTASGVGQSMSGHQRARVVGVLWSCGA